MPTYNTLDEALSDIANRAFYEDARVIPNTDGTFTVEDDFSTSYAGDNIMWTYDYGMEIPQYVFDNSSLMEPSEFFSEARHIKYWMDGAIERLESGKPVVFAYGIVSAYPDYGAYEDEDYTVGWVLMAIEG